MKIRKRSLLSTGHSRPRSNRKFELLQEYRGLVEAEEGEVLTVRLIDTSGTLPDAITDMSLSAFEPDLRAKLAVGAVFTWKIGYLTQQWGQTIRKSFIEIYNPTGEQNVGPNEDSSEGLAEDLVGEVADGDSDTEPNPGDGTEKSRDEEGVSGSREESEQAPSV